jgi:ABC-type antimicrobial peptide transport system permease subunit
MPLREETSGPLQRPLLLLLGAVGLVLLVTCANVANLVLSRAAARRRELALRATLGSSRARLLQLLLAEAAILSIAGGTIGILLSQALVAAVPAAVTSTLPTARDISVDVRVLAFTGAISILTSILFAVIPLLGSAVEDLARRFRKRHHGPRLECGGIACSRGSLSRRSRLRSCC